MQLPLKRLSEYKWEIPVLSREGMRVPGVIYADDELLEQITRDNAVKQVADVACLPGIVGASLAMPDIHWGYGFPIGGVAATDPAEGGVISPGGVGFDINCGVRLLRSELNVEEVRGWIDRILDELFKNIPCGVGVGSKLRLNKLEESRLLAEGSGWAIERGFGPPADLAATEDGGCLAGADPGRVSQRAKERGSRQVGTLGSGNHFIEVQYIDEIYDQAAADLFGLSRGGVTVMIHCGSRGLGHQVCSDYLKVMSGAVQKYGYSLPDRQLACAPAESREGKDYYAAMACAANYAWVNRQVISHQVREVFRRVFGRNNDALKMGLVYDVAHNIAKFEDHPVEGELKKLCVHRKGATRAFGQGHSELTEIYRTTGQPVLIPGDMGSSSYVLAGMEEAMEETWGSACHGAGRVMSRTAARKMIRGRELLEKLREKGIMVRAKSLRVLGEEAPQAYKDVSAVVEVVHRAGLARKVARMRPLGVIKG